MIAVPAPGSRHLKGEARFRLSGPQAFARVFKEGRRREGRYVQIVAATASASSDGRVGMVVSRKALSRAVDRNRFKRKMREALRVLRVDDHPLIRGDLVIRVKPALPREAIDAAAAEAFGLLRQRAGTGVAERS
ncbi:MAG: ribonuclease P protein component [Proteobacteria bacterium]|nr:ribonuclease P protein component [Pseudomonadota bacterium]MCL2308463.1 ribonuclease P protein component [Pseudomonadota bacterium]